MIPYDEDTDKKKRKRNPFDFFSMDEEFDRMFREMERMMERTFRDFPYNELQPGKSFVHGFNIHIGPDGKPRIREFGNRPTQSPSGTRQLSDEREPLTDVIETDEDVAVTVEIPGVDKQDIDLHVTNDTLEIKVNSPKRKYHRKVELPCDVVPDSTQATYKNGVLDVSMKRREKHSDDEGYKVNIE